MPWTTTLGAGLAGERVGERAERCAHELGAGRHALGRVAAHVGEDVPARGGERLRGGEAEAAVGAEDEDGAVRCGAGHGVFLGDAATCR